MSGNNPLGGINYKNHGESHCLPAPRLLPLQRAIYMVGVRRWRGRWWGSPPNLLHVFSPGLRHLPQQRHQGPTPVAAVVARRLVNAHWSCVPPWGNWPTHCNRSWTSPWEVSGGSTHWGGSGTPWWTDRISWRTDFWAGLVFHSWWEWTTDPSQQLQKMSIPLSAASSGLDLVAIPLSPPWSWLRHRIEMTLDTNKTHLYHESIYQQVKWWNTWIFFPPEIFIEIWILQIFHSGKLTLAWHET